MGVKSKEIKKLKRFKIRTINAVKKFKKKAISIIEEIAFLFLLIIFSPIIIICVRQLMYDFDYLLGKENDTETFGERIYNLTQKYK